MEIRYPNAHTTEDNPVFPPSADAAADCLATDTGAAPTIGAITFVIALTARNPDARFS